MTKVLVVDDDPLVRMILGIEMPDVELLEATRLEEGYELARTEKPDAVIVDVRLPDGDGIDLVRRMRRTNATSGTPILVLTAGHDEAKRAEIIAAGADEYLPKPFETTTLLTHLHELLALSQGARRDRRAGSSGKKRRWPFTR